MVLPSRLAKVTQLRQRQAEIARKHPSAFAANRIAKALSYSHAPGRPLRSATVLYDKVNATTGRALEREFQRRGIKTESRGLIGNNPNGIGRTGKDLSRVSRAEAVVFLTSGKGGRFDKIADDVVIKQAEARQRTKNGTRMALIYGINNRKATRVLASTAEQSRLMRRFTRKTYDAVKQARQIIVKTANGTNLIFSLSPRLKWIIDNGMITKKYWGNLPAGEVGTAPLRVDGRATLDGFINGVGNVERNPIQFQIKNGRVVLSSITCINPAARKRFISILTTDRNASRVGELGLGTNVTIQKLYDDILINEKIPGVHIAFGDPYPAETGARWTSEEHNDATMKNPTIIVDGKPIMRNGKSLLK